MRCLPIGQRASLQKSGIGSHNIVWAFHSESQDELLDFIPAVRQVCYSYFFFSSKGVFPKIWDHPTHSLGSTHTTLFFLQMSQIPERSKSKTSTALTVSYNLLHPGSSTSPPNDTSPLSPIFYALFSFWNAHPSFTQTTFHSFHPPSPWSTSPPVTLDFCSIYLFH